MMKFSSKTWVTIPIKVRRTFRISNSALNRLPRDQLRFFGIELYCINIAAIN